MRWKIESWRKDNEHDYYGLSVTEANTVLNHLEDAIDEIERLRKALDLIRRGANPIPTALKALGKEQSNE